MDRKKCIMNGTDSPTEKIKTDNFNSILEFWGREAKQESYNLIFEWNLTAIMMDYVETDSFGTNQSGD